MCVDAVYASYLKIHWVFSVSLEIFLKGEFSKAKHTCSVVSSYVKTLAQCLTIGRFAAVGLAYYPLVGLMNRNV